MSLVVTKVLDATDTDSTVVVPNGVLLGDLLIHKGFGQAASSPAAVVPGGFTQIVTDEVDFGANALRILISYKIADGTESGTTLTGVSGAALTASELLVFRGNVPISGVTASTPNSQIVSANPSAQNVAASGGVPPLIVIGSYACRTTFSVDPRTMSPSKDGEISASTQSYLAWKIYNSSPADVSVDMDNEGINSLQSFFLELEMIPVAGPIFSRPSRYFRRPF